MSVKVRALRNPFSRERTDKEFERGLSYREIIDELAGDSPYTAVTRNDEPIPEDRYDEIPEDDDIVSIRFTPTGSANQVGAGIKVGGMAVATVGVMVAGIMAAPLLPILAIGLGISLVGLAVMAIDWEGLMPSFSGISFSRSSPAGSSPSRDRGSTSPTIRGSRNRFRPWAPLPVIIGRHYVVPDYAAPPFSRFVGGILHGFTSSSRHTYYMLFALCQSSGPNGGPISISDVRIGETPISNFEHTIRYVDPNRPGFTNFRRFATTRIENPVNLPLEDGDSITRTTELNTSTIDVQIVFPAGLYYLDEKGGLRAVRVRFVVKVKNLETQTVTTLNTHWAIRCTQDMVRFARTYSLADYGLPNGQYDIIIEREPTRRRMDMNDPAFDNFYYEHPMGQDLTTDDDAVSFISDDMVWSSYTSRIPGPPVTADIRANTVFLEVRVVADNNLSGMIDQFNCVVQAGYRISNFSGTHYGSNPALIAMWLLRGHLNPEPQPTANIDIASFVHWQNFCNSNNLRVNGVIQDSAKLTDVLAMVARAGRATIGERDGKIVALVEEPRTNFVQHFSPRNSFGFSATKVFRRIPHGLKIGFVNEDAGYTQDEIVLYTPGYSETGGMVPHFRWINGVLYYATGLSTRATEFETIDMPWVTNSEQVTKLGTYMLAETMLRPEVYTIETDWEHLVCTRGDRVKLSHDVIKVGLSHGRIKSVSGNTITVDEQCTIEAGKSYTLAVRQESPTNVSKVYPITTGVGTHVSLDVSGSVDCEPGDLFTFGETDRETLDCIVLAIEPLDNLQARILLTEHAPAIYGVDSLEGLPQHSSNITQPAELSNVTVPAPRSIYPRSDESVIVWHGDGTYSNRIVVAIEPPASVEWFTLTGYDVEWKDTGALQPTGDENETSEWRSMTVPGEQLEVSIWEITSGHSYDVRVRARGSIGNMSSLSSNWVTSSVITYSKMFPPEIVTNVQAVIRGLEGILIRWSRVSNVDYSHFILKVGGAGWGDATTIFEGDSTSFLYERLAVGTYTFRVRAVDSSGNLSTEDAIDTITIQVPEAVHDLITQTIVVQNVINLSWRAPSITSFPISHYVVKKGSSFESGTDVAETNSTFLSIAEANVDTYQYWIAAVDVAGNMGPAEDVNATVFEIASTGSELSLLQPTIIADTFLRDVYIRSDAQRTAIKRYRYEIQVAETDDGPWYRPQNDGTDWKQGPEDSSEIYDGDVYIHANIPHAGTVDNPTERSLYYRVRRVIPEDSEASDWSDVVSSGTIPLSAGDIVQSAINQSKLADGAVTSGKIFDGAVEEAKLAVDSVSDRVIVDGGVVEAKLADGAVVSRTIAATALNFPSDAINYWPFDDVLPGQPTPPGIKETKVGSDGIITGSPEYVRGPAGGALYSPSDEYGAALPVDNDLFADHDQQWTLNIWEKESNGVIFDNGNIKLYRPTSNFYILSVRGHESLIYEDEEHFTMWTFTWNGSEIQAYANGDRLVVGTAFVPLLDTENYHLMDTDNLQILTYFEVYRRQHG